MPHRKGHDEDHLPRPGLQGPGGGELRHDGVRAREVHVAAVQHEAADGRLGKRAEGDTRPKITSAIPCPASMPGYPAYRIASAQAGSRYTGPALMTTTTSIPAGDAARIAERTASSSRCCASGSPKVARSLLSASVLPLPTCIDSNNCRHATSCMIRPSSNVSADTNTIGRYKY